jgi:hypothetical protein
VLQVRPLDHPYKTSEHTNTKQVQAVRPHSGRVPHLRNFILYKFVDHDCFGLDGEDELLRFRYTAICSTMSIVGVISVGYGFFMLSSRFTDVSGVYHVLLFCCIYLMLLLCCCESLFCRISSLTIVRHKQRKKGSKFSLWVFSFF